MAGRATSRIDSVFMSVVLAVGLCPISAFVTDDQNPQLQAAETANSKGIYEPHEQGSDTAEDGMRDVGADAAITLVCQSSGDGAVVIGMPYKTRIYEASACE